ncbi:MAG: iron ABC transporter permease [Actinobacteria bacterium]|nr:iron ABC transporter permease [Actinomycetota bacterium]
MTTTAPAPTPLVSAPLASEPRSRAPRALVVTGAVVAALFAGPVLYLAIRTVGFGDGALDVLGSSDLAGPLARTLLLATSVSAACVLLGTALAWLVTRTDLPGRRVLRVVLVLPLVIPSFVGAFALQAAFASGGLLDRLLDFGLAPRIEGFWAAFAVLTLLSYPYVYLPVAARLAVLPPALEESARSLGRTPIEVFRTLVLPQTSGAIAAGALLTFLYCVSEFGAVSLVRYDTLTLRIEATRLFDRETSITLSLVLALVALVVVTAERAMARRRTVIEAVGAGRRVHQTPLGRWRVPALVGVLILMLVALVAPITVLAEWAARGDSGRFGVGVADDLLGPVANTVVISVVTALVATLAVLPIAYLTARHRSRVGGVVNALVVAGFALPGLVIALALVFWVLGTPVVSGLYQSFPLLVFAYVVHFGAQALRASQVAVSGLPARLDDAARALGARRWRRLRTVELPLMAPGLAAGAGLVLLATMKELPATLLLAPIGFDTLATRIWSASETGLMARAGLTSIVLVALSAVLTWAVTIRRMDRLDR